MQMPQVMPIIITVILSLSYSGLIVWIYRGWKKSLSSTDLSSDPYETVTIMIPVRNEADHIKRTIQHILENDYPKTHYEILVIDDHSTDETANIVQSLSHENIRYLSLPGHLTGKKHAITYGVEHAKFDIILCTDGDTLPSTSWIKCHAEQYKNEIIQICTGIVLPKVDNTLLSQFQWLDFASMMSVTANGIERNSYYLANGASLSYRKSAFIENDGFAGNLERASGDDIFLVQKIAQQKPKSVGFVHDNNAICYTKSEASWSAFFNQRKRWASKAMNSFDSNVKWVQGYIFVYTLMIIVAIPLGILFPAYGLLSLIVLWATKFITDYIHLYRLSTYYQNKEAMLWFLPAFLMYIVHILLSGYHALCPPLYDWKGREVR